MLFRIFLLAVLTFSFDAGYAQLQLPASSMGAGSAGTVESNSWSTLHPATMSGLSHSVAAMGINQRYLIGKLSSGAFSIVKPFRSNHFGFTILTTGYHSFRHTRFKFAYSKSLSQSITAGGAVNYSLISIKELDQRKNFVTADFGTLIHLSENIFGTIHLSGVTNAKQLVYEQLNAGVAIKASDNVRLISEIRKDQVEKACYSVGVEYEITSSKVRGGITTSPVTFCSGYSFEGKDFTLDLGMSYDLRLGPVNAISFSWRWE